MNLDKLNKGIENLRKNIGEALIESGIWASGTGTPITGFQLDPQIVPFFDQTTDYLSKILNKTNLPELDDFYILELKDNKMVIILLFPEGFQWGILADKTKLNLGMLHGIAIPQAKKNFYEAYED